MKQSIGTVWITTLVITFMLIFVGYLTFMISYADATMTKDDVLSIIEKRNGITSMSANCNYKSIFSSKKNLCNGYGTIESINLYLKGRNYRLKGRCPTNGDTDTWYGVKTLKNSKSGSDLYEKAKANTNYFYCFTRLKYGSKNISTNSYYYKVVVFYQFDLPIMSAMEIPVEGKTNAIIKPSNCEIKQYRPTNAEKTCPRWKKVKGK